MIDNAQLSCQITPNVLKVIADIGILLVRVPSGPSYGNMFGNGDIKLMTDIVNAGFSKALSNYLAKVHQ